jgi:predicted dienelactone hydrolase
MIDRIAVQQEPEGAAPKPPAKKPVVYISGPMTGLENYNHAAFNQLASELAERGYIVLNPAILPLGLTDAAYMDIGIAMLRAADVVALLDGYQHSKGALSEKTYAERIGIPCIPVSELD